MESLAVEDSIMSKQTQERIRQTQRSSKANSWDYRARPQVVVKKTQGY